MAVQNTDPADDWVSQEAEALLASDPELRADVRQAIADHRLGKLQTVDTATVRAALDARIKSRYPR